MLYHTGRLTPNYPITILKRVTEEPSPCHLVQKFSSAERNSHTTGQIHLFSLFESSDHILKKDEALNLAAILEVSNLFLYKESLDRLFHEPLVQDDQFF